MSQTELIQYLIRESNRLGRKGIKVIGWLSPQSACADEKGTWITMFGETRCTAGGEE